MSDFQLEERYFFVKYKDLNNLNNEDFYRAMTAIKTLDDLLPPRKALVIEDDFPIYNQVYKLLSESV